MSWMQAGVGIGTRMACRVIGVQPERHDRAREIKKSRKAREWLLCLLMNGSGNLLNPTHFFRASFGKRLTDTSNTILTMQERTPGKRSPFALSDRLRLAAVPLHLWKPHKCSRRSNRLPS